MSINALKGFIAEQAIKAREAAQGMGAGSTGKQEQLKDAHRFERVASILNHGDELLKTDAYTLAINMAKVAMSAGFYQQSDIPDESNNLRDFWIAGNNIAVSVKLLQDIEALNLQFLEQGVPFLPLSLSKEVREFIEINTPESTDEGEDHV
jgi:hypothetical protein